MTGKQIVAMQERVSEYYKLHKEINTLIKNIKRNSGNVENVSSDIDEQLSQLKRDVNRFMNMSELLVREVDNYTSPVIKLTGAEINYNMRHLKNRVRLLKRGLYDEYNKNIQFLVTEKNRLLGMAIEFPELLERINNVVIPSTINKKNVNYNASLKDLDYSVIKTASDEIKEVGYQMGIGLLRNTVLYEMDSSIEQVEINIEKLKNDVENLVNNKDSKLSMDDLYNELENCMNGGYELINKLSINSGKMFDVDYNEYNEIIDNLFVSMYEVKSKLDDVQLKKYNEDKVKELYNKYKKDINSIIREMEIYGDLMHDYEGMFTADYISVFNNKISYFEKSIDEIDKKIEDIYNEKGLEALLYNNLNALLNKARERLDNTKKIGNNTSMYVENDSYKILYNCMNNIDDAINKLDLIINKQDKLINKETRKKVDLVIKKIYQEIANLERLMYSNEFKNEEDDNELEERLANARSKMKELSSKYQSKCPLMVKTVKSAKKFYKKYPKVSLLVGGLAAFSLVNMTVGPLIIPTIMYGNEMLITTAPSISGFMIGVNNILGGMIGARRMADGWLLANGIKLTSSAVSTSLLKGIATSVLGTGALVGTIVAAKKQIFTKQLVVEVKDLVDKVKQVELKDKLKDNVGKVYENGKKSVKSTIEKGKNSEVVKKVKKYMEETSESIASSYSIPTRGGR